jgi:hypothetical protein
VIACDQAHAGFVQAQLLLLSRPALRPLKEIVGTALFLASGASSYLTGELILLDGG